LKEFIASHISFNSFKIFLNALDERGKGEAGLYLTVNGTSADGAAGQVGRGIELMV
jgi:S-adenosylmethionine synthetase